MLKYVSTTDVVSTSAHNLGYKLCILILNKLNRARNLVISKMTKNLCLFIGFNHIVTAEPMSIQFGMYT